MRTTSTSAAALLVSSLSIFAAIEAAETIVNGDRFVVCTNGEARKLYEPNVKLGSFQVGAPPSGNGISLTPQSSCQGRTINSGLIWTETDVTKHGSQRETVKLYFYVPAAQDSTAKVWYPCAHQYGWIFNFDTNKWDSLTTCYLRNV